MDRFKRDENGTVRQWWSVGARKYREYDSAGVLTFERDFTAEENAAADAEIAANIAATNEAALRDKARSALANNSTYLALPSPTNAQNLAQIRALTRQVNALIKLEVRDLADQSST